MERRQERRACDRGIAHRRRGRLSGQKQETDQIAEPIHQRRDLDCQADAHPSKARTGAAHLSKPTAVSRNRPLRRASQADRPAPTIPSADPQNSTTRLVPASPPENHAESEAYQRQSNQLSKMSGFFAHGLLKWHHPISVCLGLWNGNIHLWSSQVNNPVELINCFITPRHIGAKLSHFLGRRISHSPPI